jgi:hypothetical protein
MGAGLRARRSRHGILLRTDRPADDRLRAGRASGRGIGYVERTTPTRHGARRRRPWRSVLGRRWICERPSQAAAR